MKPEAIASKTRFGLLQLRSNHGLLLPSLIRRDIAARYRGSVLGILWSLLTPLFLLGIYTFVFGGVFRARWPGSGEDASIAEFSIILFAGLITYQLFAEVIGRAPSLILSNQTYVTKVVFPLEILVPVALGSALFHYGVSLVVLIGFILLVHGAVPLTAVLLPVVLAPLCLIILGLAWFFASLGTFVRDIGQVLGTIITAMLFLSPIFFPLAALPEWLRPWIALNPLTVPVSQTRQVLIFGEWPDPVYFGMYTAVAMLICCLGYLWFQKTRKGFADVL